MGEQNCIQNDPGHMTKMAVMPIYVKTSLKIFFFGIDWPVMLNLSKQNWPLGYYQVCPNDDPRLTFDLFLFKGQLCFLMHFYGKT